MATTITNNTIDLHLESVKGLLKQMKTLSCLIKDLDVQFNGDRLNFIISPAKLLEQIVIHQVEHSAQLSEEATDSAIVDVVLQDGIWTANGFPIWNMLPGEEIVYYELFNQYKNLRSSRSLYKLHELTQVKIRTLKLLSDIWQWPARACAYDEYQVKLVEINRQENTLLMEDRHRQTAVELFTKASSELMRQIPEMEGKELVKVMEMAIRLERASLGLDPDRPYTTKANNEVNINLTSNETIIETQQINPRNRTENEEQISEVLKELLKVNALDIKEMELANDSVEGDNLLPTRLEEGRESTDNR